MILKLFKTVRSWERYHNISNAYSFAYAIFGIAIPSAVVFGIAKIGEDYFKRLPPDSLLWALFGSWIISCIALWFFDSRNIQD